MVCGREIQAISRRTLLLNKRQVKGQMMRRCHLKPAWETDLPHVPLALWLDASAIPPDHPPQPCLLVL